MGGQLEWEHWGGEPSLVQEWGRVRLWAEVVEEQMQPRRKGLAKRLRLEEVVVEAVRQLPLLTSTLQQRTLMQCKGLQGVA
jgi:hypothetical protein